MRVRQSEGEREREGEREGVSEREVRPWLSFFFFLITLEPRVE